METVPEEIFWKHILPLLPLHDAVNVIQSMHLSVAGYERMRSAWIGLEAFKKEYHAAAVELHLQFKMKKDYTADELWELLALASHHNHKQAVSLLLDVFDVPLPDRSRFPLILTAAANDNIAITKLICNKLNYSLQKLRVLNNHLLRTVCEKGSVTVLEWLLSEYNFQSRDVRACYNACLRMAATNGHLSIVKKLISHFNLVAKDALYHEAGALRGAGANGHADVFEYLLSTFPEITINDLAGGNGSLFKTIHVRQHFHILEIIEKKYGRDAILNTISRIPSMHTTCPCKPPRRSPSSSSFSTGRRRKSRDDLIRERRENMQALIDLPNPHVRVNNTQSQKDSNDSCNGGEEDDKERHRIISEKEEGGEEVNGKIRIINHINASAFPNTKNNVNVINDCALEKNVYLYYRRQQIINNHNNTAIGNIDSILDKKDGLISKTESTPGSSDDNNNDDQTRFPRQRRLSVGCLEEVEEVEDSVSIVLKCTSVCLPVSPFLTIVQSSHKERGMLQFNRPSFSDIDTTVTTFSS
eukprot:m.227956 g.227956  ORF g.227956 m.227956 type:complete len:528 (+) comp13875_c0_seq1:266-1849(+)